MRKNRLLLCVALMLVFAMSLAMFVACADDQTEKPIDPDTPVTPDTGDGPTGDTGMNNGGGSSSSTVDGVTVVQSGLSAQKAFEINGGMLISLNIPTQTSLCSPLLNRRAEFRLLIASRL